MKSFRSSILPLLALGLALPALGDSPATKQWVLATAKATGAGGESFVSSLRIVNPGTATANVTLSYLAQSPIEEILEECLLINRDIALGRVPKRPDWAEKSHRTCARCPYRKVCYAPSTRRNLDVTTVEADAGA